MKAVMCKSNSKVLHPPQQT